MYLANPCSSDVVLEAMEAGTIGLIDTPAQANQSNTDRVHAAGVPWCADNGAFSDRFDERKWWAFLLRRQPWASTCLFAAAPDVVGDAAATLTRSVPWLPKIRALGYPAALVAQDGLEHLTVPWDDFDVLFIGGTDQFKLGHHAIRLAEEARRHGKRVHVGRVNSDKRFRFAARPYPFGLGADTADGTFLTFAPDHNLGRLLRWLEPAGPESLFDPPKETR